MKRTLPFLFRMKRREMAILFSMKREMLYLFYVKGDVKSNSSVKGYFTVRVFQEADCSLAPHG